MQILRSHPLSQPLVFAAQHSGHVPPLVAVATLLQGSTSAICVLRRSGIDRPAALTGRRYASYGGRFEDAIVRHMVNADGGDGTQVKCHPLDAHGYLDPGTQTSGSVVASYLQRDKSDSTWIFAHWEGLLANAEDALDCFALEDYGVPYGYTPILLANAQRLGSEEAPGPFRATARAFLAATAQGFELAATNPDECACMLRDESGSHPSLSDEDFVKRSARSIAGKYLHPGSGSWGQMEPQRWQAFVDFLFEAGAVTTREGEIIPRSAIDVASLWTNDLLPDTATPL